MAEKRRIVVTGLGALTPIGLSVEAFWEGMMEGRSGAGPITRFDASEFPTRFACELKDFRVEEYLDRKQVRRMDPFAQYGMVATMQAIKDSGLDPETMPQELKDQVGIIFSSGIGGIQTLQEQSWILKDGGPRRMSPLTIPRLIIDILPGHISMEYGFRGPNYSVVSACATGNNSMGDAYFLIREGYSPVVITGGAEAPIVELGVGGFTAMRALSTRNDEPERASRPFDATRDGFVMGEGAGALVFEELEFAKARGARIYTEVVGVGLSADAYHLTAPDPDGTGAALAMQRALEDAGIPPEDIDYLNMHGTGTPLGDIAETKAVKKVFGNHAYKMSLSSTKSMTGHLLGAAGAVEAIATILAIMYDTVPPTINFEHPDPECDLDYTFNVPRKRPIRYAMSNAFGFGGHNTCMVFKKYEE